MMILWILLCIYGCVHAVLSYVLAALFIECSKSPSKKTFSQYSTAILTIIFMPCWIIFGSIFWLRKSKF